MKFLFTCGGTAGHINPAIAVAGRIAMAAPDSEFLFIGAEGRMETDLVPRAGYEIKTVRITNLHRSLKPADIKHNLATLKNVLTATAEAKHIIREFQPDVAVGTGGYVCYPVLKAASELGIPTAVHESNAVPGPDHQDAGGLGKHHHGRLRGEPRELPPPGPRRGHGHARARGLPRPGQGRRRRELGIPEGKPLVVSVWGSLGASHMNEIMTDFILRACAKPFFSLIHSAGKAGYSKMSAALESEKPDYAKLAWTCARTYTTCLA